jgi:dTDP-4-amino-4,6-dideoxygalactose transaminase
MSSTKKQRPFIPFSMPWIGKDEIGEILHCLESGWLTTGPKTFQFEQELKEYLGAWDVVAVSSCTAALNIAYAASGLGPGDEVIMSPMTFCATANVAVHLGATPRFVDIEEDTFNIDCDRIEGTINKRTKLIVPVDFAGHPCHLDRISEIASKHNLRIVEDAAHAIGAEYKGKKIGSTHWPACFSFYPIKNMTTGEGGAIACHEDRNFVDHCRRLSLHGISKDAWARYSEKGSWYYEVIEPGYKYNMTDLQAALGIHQLHKLDEFNVRRQHLAELYDQAFKAVPQIRRPTVLPGIRHVRHLYVVQLQDLPSRLTRERVIEELKTRGIGTSVHFIPLHLHPYYRDHFGLKPKDFPTATKVFQRSISLPLYPKMADSDVAYVAEQLIDILTS